MAQSAGVKRCGVAVYVGAWRVVKYPGIRIGRARAAPFGALLQLGLLCIKGQYIPPQALRRLICSQGIRRRGQIRSHLPVCFGSAPLPHLRIKLVLFNRCHYIAAAAQMQAYKFTAAPCNTARRSCGNRAPARLRTCRIYAWLPPAARW